MLLLSTDTSGKNGSIALARAGDRPDPNDIAIIEVVPLDGGTFSAQLVPQIAALLAKYGFSKRDIDVFVVVSGPGSFTGLRVGLAAIKALAEILQKPIVPVSLLEAMSCAGKRGKAVAALDGGRGEIFVGEYEVEDHSTHVLQERLLTKNEFLSTAQGTTVVTSDSHLAELARVAGLSVTLVKPMDAGAVARFGWRKLQSGETVTPEQLEANYIRRTDAEIFAKPNP